MVSLQRRLSLYVYVPPFVTDVVNTWSVEPNGDNHSVAKVHFQMDMMPIFKQLMSGMMSRRLEKRADGVLSELKYYAENGTAKLVVMEQLETA